MPLQPGEKLGAYEILSTLGKGGMGEVYRAHDSRLKRDVAIKVSTAQFSERFEREAQAIAALNHPHICQLYDVGPNYLVMEYIEGTALKGPLPVDQALKYAAQICDALDAAHKKGVTHCDLQPSNILVNKQGIKLLDFGLATLGISGIAQAAKPPDGGRFAVGLPGKNELVGTLNYMSPEQLRAEANSREIDGRSDIFSFGLVLYEMLTGKRAFEGSSPAGVIAAILERPAPSIADVAPPLLDHVLKICLAKDPDERWQSARDLKWELEWIANGRSHRYGIIRWLLGIDRLEPASPLRPVFLLNLACLILLGTAACGWVLYFTSWFPELGGLLALGGLFSWMAFVLRLVPDDTAKALRESFGALLNRPIIFAAILAIAAILWRLSAGYGAVRIEAHQATVPREAWIYSEKHQQAVTLAVEGDTNIVVPISGSATEHLKIRGRPMLSLVLKPRDRSVRSYPDSFQRHVVLVTPSAQLIKNLARSNAAVQLDVAVAGTQAQRTGPVAPVFSLKIANYTWFPFWIGCSDDVALNDVARLQLMSIARDLPEPQSSIFSFPPRSEPGWYCATCSSWTDAERELPDGGALTLIMSIGAGKKRHQFGSKTLGLPRSSDFIQMVIMNESDFK
jgi:predicted Ser/Thr protein kinase